MGRCYKTFFVRQTDSLKLLSHDFCKMCEIDVESEDLFVKFRMSRANKLECLHCSKLARLDRDKRTSLSVPFTSVEENKVLLLLIDKIVW